MRHDRERLSVWLPLEHLPIHYRHPAIAFNILLSIFHFGLVKPAPTEEVKTSNSIL
jgi:hypothetical protein